MLFCANLLIVNDSPDGIKKWACQTCPYLFPIHKQYTSRIHLKRKTVGAVRDILQELRDSAARTEDECQICGHGFAYFIQLQTRSADEPMTVWYREALLMRIVPQCS
ncbi:hypothetical protein FB45DRAFT_1033372 [Roridomyces roridus]|uniref:DNA-directed RNA polymerase subunit n=1 Tax=Roridomyces roridus TaxID=1738132 RepID=A0AAD7BF86_9AGAR|nr:hypothetical protein FB45DRAFT_1033372 [Roridomyces roridus]